MKVSQIINEGVDIQEDPMGIIGRSVNRVGKYFGSATATGRLEAGKEANRLRNDLGKWMGGSGIKRGQLTISDLEQFLKSSGYTGATEELQRLRARRAGKSQKRQAAVRRAGQMAVSAAAGVKAGARAAVDTYNTRMKNIESVNESDNVPLTNDEIDKVIKAVVASGYRANTGARAGRFSSRQTDNQTTSTVPKLGGASRNAPVSRSPSTAKIKLAPEVVAALSNMSDSDRRRLAAALTGGTQSPKLRAPKPASGKTPAALARGTKKRGPDGDEYEWMGARWRNLRTGRIAGHNMADKL